MQTEEKNLPRGKEAIRSKSLALLQCARLIISVRLQHQRVPQGVNSSSYLLQWSLTIGHPSTQRSQSKETIGLGCFIHVTFGGQNLFKDFLTAPLHFCVQKPPV